MFVPWKVDKGISGDVRHILVVFYLGGAPNDRPWPPQGPQWFQMDDLVFHEKSRSSILRRDDLTVGKLGVSPMEADKRNIW